MLVVDSCSGSSVSEALVRKPRAALIYQRATSEADARIADRLSTLIDEHRVGERSGDPDGGS